MHCIMLEYAPMLHVSYFAQNYAGIIHQGLNSVINTHYCLKVCYLTIIELWVHVSDLGLKLGSRDSKAVTITIAQVFVTR